MSKVFDVDASAEEVDAWLTLDQTLYRLAERVLPPYSTLPAHHAAQVLQSPATSACAEADISNENDRQVLPLRSTLA